MLKPQMLKPANGSFGIYLESKETTLVTVNLNEVFALVQLLRRMEM